MAPGGEMLRYHQHFGENVLLYGSHEWLPYSKNAVRTKSPNTNLPCPCGKPVGVFSHRILTGNPDLSHRTHGFRARITA